MVNPFVRDTVARVGRDPRRKLGWDDRLVGAMRRARQAGVTPRRYAWGVAAALDWLAIPPAATMDTMRELWGMTELDLAEASALCALILQASRGRSSSGRMKVAQRCDRWRVRDEW
jgi:mannitol-1-phosphate/altronate dehydrogenase